MERPRPDLRLLFWALSLGLLASSCGGRSGNQQQSVPGGNQYNPPPPQPGSIQGPVATTPTTPPPSPLSPLCNQTTAPLVCGTHRCNPQNGRCAFPCGSTQDCIPGFSCLGAGGPAAICVPGVN